MVHKLVFKCRDAFNAEKGGKRDSKNCVKNQKADRGFKTKVFGMINIFCICEEAIFNYFDKKM